MKFVAIAMIVISTLALIFKGAGWREPPTTNDWIAIAIGLVGLVVLIAEPSA